MSYDLFPQQLKEQKQWVLWKKETVGDKLTKIPYRNTAQKASSTDPETWQTFEETNNWIEKFPDNFNGIGYVFKEGVVGIDLDHCFEEDGFTLEQWAKDIVDLFPSYIEISPSGTGLHIFILCNIDFKGAKTYIGNGDIERYCKGRYFTVTGNIYGEYNKLITVEPEHFLAWHNSYEKKEPIKEIPTQTISTLLPNDNKILEVMFKSKHGLKLKDLYEGNWQKYFRVEEKKSQSEADLSFVDSLMFFCQNDTATVDRIFRSSGLMRDKWDRKDYRDEIFRIAHSTEVMKWDMNIDNQQQEEKIERVIVPINAILDMEEKEEPFILDGMIVENSVNALTANNGKGKSLVALKMIESIVKGESFLGEFKTKKTKTLILDLEMSQNDIIQRSKSIIHEKMEGLDFYYCQTFNIDNIDDYKWLTDSIINNNYKLIVFDTLSAIHEREENSNSEMNLVNKKLIELCNKYGVTVLFLHHHKKPIKGEIQNQASSRGAGSIIDKAASHLLLDSKESVVAIGEEGGEKIGLKGLHITIEQMKPRQWKHYDKFSINSYYNPATKHTNFEFGGFDNKEDNAIAKTKTLILSKMEVGEEYMMRHLKEMAGKSSNLYEAIRELTEVDKILGSRTPDEGETEDNGRKIRKDSKIFFLTHKT
jgi:primase-polymerase (primpol)-like protein